MSQELIVVADAHLDGLNNELDRFLSFLAQLQERHIHSLFILGDLFNIWLGAPKLLLSHQKPVIDALQRLHNAGIQINYVEGNRDYFLAPLYLHAPFQNIASEFLKEEIGEKQYYFSHGDLVNIHDRQYRLWRKFSRNRLLFSVFNYLPQTVAVHIVHLLEQKFRTTNTRHKASFPLKTCRTYADSLWKQGYDVIILGHFHEGHYFTISSGHSQKALYVLPEWKKTYTYLSITAEKKPVFSQFDPHVKRET